MTRRHRTLAAGLCLAVVLVAAVFPGATALDFVVFDLAWEWLPAIDTPARVPDLPPAPRHTRALRSPLPSRAPPASFAA